MKTPAASKRFLFVSLLAALLALGVMTLTLSQTSENLSNHVPVTAVDARLNDWLHRQVTPFRTGTMLAITSLGSTALVTCIAVVFGVYLVWRRRFAWLAAMLASVFGGMLLNKMLKLAFQRPRPFFDDPIVTVTGYSFPSGHTMAATVLYGVLAAYFFTRTPDRRGRVLIVLAAGFVIALVAFSRMYLGAHYLTDVLTAMVEGLAWISICLTTADVLRRRRDSRGDDRGGDRGGRLQKL
jgi:undecaprenyl-diphosphatase